MWFLNQSLMPVETTAVFASSQITRILTLDLHKPIPGFSAQSKLTNISTSDQLQKPTVSAHLSTDMMLIC